MAVDTTKCLRISRWLMDDSRLSELQNTKIDWNCARFIVATIGHLQHWWKHYSLRVSCLGQNTCTMSTLAKGGGQGGQLIPSQSTPQSSPLGRSNANSKKKQRRNTAKDSWRPIPSRIDVMKQAWAGFFFSSMHFGSNNAIAAFCCTAKRTFCFTAKSWRTWRWKGGTLDFYIPSFVTWNACEKERGNRKLASGDAGGHKLGEKSRVTHHSCLCCLIKNQVPCNCIPRQWSVQRCIEQTIKYN